MLKVLFKKLIIKLFFKYCADEPIKIPEPITYEMVSLHFKTKLDYRSRDKLNADKIKRLIVKSFEDDLVNYVEWYLSDPHPLDPEFTLVGELKVGKKI